MTTKICANCDRIIKGNLIFNCTCNKEFCSQECLTDYHEEENEFDKKADKLDKEYDQVLAQIVSMISGADKWLIR